MGLDIGITRTINNSEDEVAYWRKANQIYNWFIKKYPNNRVEECNSVEVSIESLIELKQTCEKVINDKSLASSLLPPLKGFFFGTYKYDEWYFQDLKDTINHIDFILKYHNNHKDQNIKYTFWSSW